MSRRSIGYTMDTSDPVANLVLGALGILLLALLGLIVWLGSGEAPTATPTEPPGVVPPSASPEPTESLSETPEVPKDETSARDADFAFDVLLGSLTAVVVVAITRFLLPVLARLISRVTTVIAVVGAAHEAAGGANRSQDAASAEPWIPDSFPRSPAAPDRADQRRLDLLRIWTVFAAAVLGSAITAAATVFAAYLTLGS